MTAFLRRLSWVGLCLAAGCLTGCNVLALPFFILGPEPTVAASLKRLAPEDRKKQVKVMVLAHAGPEVPPDFRRVDRDLSDRMRASLRQGFEYYKDNVKIIAPRRVEDFKNENPGWEAMDLEEIGKRFEVDYVVYLEIRKLTIYEKGSGNTLYRGRAEISVSLVDVNDREEGEQRKEFICQFPSETKHAIPVEDVNPQKFRNDFLNYVAGRLSWCFVPHPTSKEHDCE